jgi:predicted secreted protein
LKKILLLLIMATMMAFPGGASAQLSPGDFIDIHKNWAKQDIQMVSSLGFMNGTGRTDQGFRIFSPEDTVSRAQLSTVLQRVFQLDYGQIRFIKQPLASDYFRDVENEAWYADGLVMCAINNIFKTTGDFYPDRSVTRIEIARSIYRSFNAKGISVPMIMVMPIYHDTNNLSNEDSNAMVFVSNTGIMKGDNNYFRPEQNMTRAELAKVINRCISIMAVNEVYNEKVYELPVGQTFIISLSSNSTTGYLWSMKINNEILEPMGNAYQDNAALNNQFAIGQGGREYWQFKALQAGTHELQMVYARPWESVQPAQVFNLKVIVTEPETSNNSIIISNNAVKSLAWQIINRDIANYESRPEVNIIDSKITRLELLKNFDMLTDTSIDVYALEYRLLPENLSKVMMAGGMQSDEDGWLKETSSMGSPLLIISRNGIELDLIGTLWTGGMIEDGGLEASIKNLLERNK